MREIDSGGQRYKIEKMNPIQQFHVARRVGPVFAICGITAAHLSGEERIEVAGFIPILGPMTQVLSQMPDEDANYVIGECLARIERRVGDRWAPLTASRQAPTAAPVMMFEDTDLKTILQLTWESLKENLGSFMQGPAEPTESPGPSAT